MSLEIGPKIIHESERIRFEQTSSEFPNFVKNLISDLQKEQRKISRSIGKQINNNNNNNNNNIIVIAAVAVLVVIIITIRRGATRNPERL